MTTLTNSTKPFPWKAAARLIGVGLLMLAKALWWLTKRGVVLLGTVFGFTFVVMKAVAVVCIEDDGDKEQIKKNDSIYAEEGELGMDENDQTSFNGANRLKVL